jgi:uncharacterized damage-inducible protein DinB
MTEEFTDRAMRGASFHNVDLSGARFVEVDLTGAVIRGAVVADVVIDGDVSNLAVNGVHVMPFVEAELDRRYPERQLMRPRTADDYRAAWPVLERLWHETVERARLLPPDLLHQRVDGEWSFIETLRHLVCATDSWVLRTMLGEPYPYHPLGLPHTAMGPGPEVPNDPHARPDLDEMLAVRAERTAVVAKVIAELTDERLAEETTPVPGNHYPSTGAYPVRRCLGAIISEEWHHRLFAERDLAELATSVSGR